MKTTELHDSIMSENKGKTEIPDMHVYGKIVHEIGIGENKDLREIDNVLDFMDEHYKFVDYEKKEFTFVGWFYEWLETGTLNIKSTTRSSYKSTIDTHISRVFKKMKLEDVTTNHIQQFIMSLVKGVGIPEPMSPKSIKNIYGVVHKCLSVAVERNYISSNPADNITLPISRRKEPHPLTTTQLVDFLKAIEFHGKRDLFLLTLFTGMREGEIIGLTWDCYDEDNGTLRIYRQIIYNRENTFMNLEHSKTIKQELSHYQDRQENYSIDLKWRTYFMVNTTSSLKMIVELTILQLRYTIHLKKLSQE